MDASLSPKLLALGLVLALGDEPAWNVGSV